MLFSSITFLYYFLPCVLAAYFIAPKRWRNAVLLGFSLTDASTIILNQINSVMTTSGGFSLSDTSSIRRLISLVM